MSNFLSELLQVEGGAQPNLAAQEIVRIAGKCTVVELATRDKTLVHDVDSPGIGTPSVCRIKMALSSNTTAVATVAATVVSWLLTN